MKEGVERIAKLGNEHPCGMQALVSQPSENLSDIYLYSLADTYECHNGWVDLASFQAAQIGFFMIAKGSQLLQAPAFLAADLADIRAEYREVLVFFVVFHDED